jgi:hypothetical protein
MAVSSLGRISVFLWYVYQWLQNEEKSDLNMKSASECNLQANAIVKGAHHQMLANLIRSFQL